MDNLKEIVDGLELATRVREVRNYAEQEAEKVWGNMIDLSNGITPYNRKRCATSFSRKMVLVTILNDLVKPVGHQGANPVENLYEDLIRDLQNTL